MPVRRPGWLRSYGYHGSDACDVHGATAYPSVLLGAAGIVVTVVVLASATPLMPPGASLTGLFALWMATAVIAGFLLRSARRKIFFYRRLSVHESLSFEAIFQAAILFNPQLAYPDVESEFLARHMDCSTEKISPWFRVRAAAALAIPLALAAMVLRLAHMELWAGLVALGCVAWVVTRSNEFRGVLRRRFLAAMTLGVLASLAEGLLFTKAAVSANLVTEPWAAFLLYSILLAAFELSPVPFTSARWKSAGSCFPVYQALAVCRSCWPRRIASSARCRFC